jgi:hypothetical protein
VPFLSSICTVSFVSFMRNLITSTEPVVSIPTKMLRRASLLPCS